MTEREDLVEGAYYWVLIALDPDAIEPWENEEMPARYAGNGAWYYINQEGAVSEADWAVRWIGPRIEHNRR